MARDPELVRLEKEIAEAESQEQAAFKLQLEAGNRWWGIRQKLNDLREQMSRRLDEIDASVEAEP